MAEYKTYSQKLGDHRWLLKRAEIIERDNNQCRNCDEEKNLQVHHTIYMNGLEPWEYENETLVTLCENCHLDTENELDKIKWIVARLQQERPYFCEQIRVLLQRHLSPESLYELKGMRFKHG